MDVEELVDELTSSIVKRHYAVFIKVPGEDKLRQVTEIDIVNVHKTDRHMMPYDLSAEDKQNREVSVVLTVG